MDADPPGLAPQITYMNHNQTAERMLQFFPGVGVEQLPGGEAWAIETVQISTHNGTHLDAPYHFHSTMNNGERAITIDEVPLEWCMGPGVKLDSVSYTHLTLPTNTVTCRSRWSPYH